MNVLSKISITLFLCFTTQAYGGTRFESWDAFTDRQTGQPHHSYRILNTKRGLFLGPCGFGTRSIQWMYWIDLVGSQQLFQTRQIKIEDDDRKRVPVISGTIVINSNEHTATLNLQITKQGRVTDFEGNGKHRIQPH